MNGRWAQNKSKAVKKKKKYNVDRKTEQRDTKGRQRYEQPQTDAAMSFVVVLCVF